MMITNGRSLWSFYNNSEDKETSPVLCECGYRRKIGGDKGKEASFFYDESTGEFVCLGCGLIRRV